MYDTRDTPPKGVLLITEALNRSVRPVLAYGFGLSIIGFTALGIPVDGAFLGIAGMVIGFFYQARQEEKKEARLEAQQRELIDLAKQVPPPPPPKPS